MVEMKLSSIRYVIDNDLSLIDKCKIAVHFSNDYDCEPNFYLKHKTRNEVAIQIMDYQILFCHMEAKEAYEKFEEITTILCLENKDGTE